jgi:phosphoribosylglycinamide formyltransferase-1
MINIALFASGEGSNAKSILEAIQNQELDVKVCALICNVEGAGVLEVAKLFGIPCFCIPHKGLKREDHEAQVIKALSEFEINYWVLAGYMRLLSPSLIQTINKDGYKIVNIHPSLLPAFKGVNAYEQAFDYGVQVAGCTVHFVDETLDGGPIIAQASFERLPEEPLETFKARGLSLEHQFYPEVLQCLAEDRVELKSENGSGRPKVLIRELVCAG